MIGMWGGTYGKLGPLRKPGQIIAAVLNPAGYLLQGGRTGSRVASVLDPVGSALLRSQGLTHRQQVAAVQAEAHAAIANAPPPAPVQPWRAPEALPLPRNFIIGVAALAGAILVTAAYFGKRRRS